MDSKSIDRPVFNASQTNGPNTPHAPCDVDSMQTRTITGYTDHPLPSRLWTTDPNAIAIRFSVFDTTVSVDRVHRSCIGRRIYGRERRRTVVGNKNLGGQNNFFSYFNINFVSIKDLGFFKNNIFYNILFTRNHS
jgi:hypothetical protein